MGNIKCLNCRNEISMISGMACPHCGARLSHTLISFLTYLGPEDSLSGYQRSYKLVLLNSIFELVRAGYPLHIASVTEKFRDYYILRKEAGLAPEKSADPCIMHAEKSRLSTVFRLIEKNPYRVISSKGYIKIKGEGQNGTFVLQSGIDNLTAKEIDGILELLDKKLKLYYRQIDIMENNVC